MSQEIAIVASLLPICSQCYNEAALAYLPSARAIEMIPLRTAYPEDRLPTAKSSQRATKLFQMSTENMTNTSSTHPQADGAVAHAQRLHGTRKHSTRMFEMSTEPWERRAGIHRVGEGADAQRLQPPSGDRPYPTIMR